MSDQSGLPKRGRTIKPKGTPPVPPNSPTTPSISPSPPPSTSTTQFPRLTRQNAMYNRNVDGSDFTDEAKAKILKEALSKMEAVVSKFYF